MGSVSRKTELRRTPASSPATLHIDLQHTYGKEGQVGTTLQSSAADRIPMINTR